MSHFLLYLGGGEWAYVTLLHEFFMYNVVEDRFVLTYGRVIRWGKGLG